MRSTTSRVESQGPGVVLLPEGAAVAVATDYSMETTPLFQRRFSRSVTVQSSGFVMGEQSAPKGADEWRVWLVEAEHLTTLRGQGENGRTVSEFVPGRCMLYLDAGRRGLEEWITTPERVEELANAMLIAVAKAREAGLFK